MAIGIVKSGGTASASTGTTLGTGGQPSDCLAIAIIALPVTADDVFVESGPTTWERAAYHVTEASRLEVWTCITDPTDAHVKFSWGTLFHNYSAAYIVLSGASFYSVETYAGGSPGTTMTTPSVTSGANGSLLAFFSPFHDTGVDTAPELTVPAGMTSVKSGKPLSNTRGRQYLLAHESRSAEGETGERTSSMSLDVGDWVATSITVSDTTNPPTAPPTNSVSQYGESAEPPTAQIQRRYFDSTQLRENVDAASTFAEVEAACAPFKSAYGVAISSVVMGDAGFDSEPYDITDPYYKDSVKTVVDEMSKYPPEFVKLCGLTSIYLCKNMTAPDTSRDYGGVCYGPYFILDMYGATTITETESDDGHRGFKFVVHHEFQHTMYFKWQTEWDGMRAQWEANNPAGFTYTEAGWDDPAGTPRPEGFVRDYARALYREDLADTWAHVMVTELYDQTLGWEAADPGVSGKVQILKDWVAAKFSTMTAPEYYDTVHAAFAGYDTTVQPWGQQLIRALGIGAWSKISGPDVAFTADGADLTLDPAPSFAEQTFVFDYGGDQTTVTVAPATWGVKQGGAVVPVRLTTK